MRQYARGYAWNKSNSISERSSLELAPLSSEILFPSKKNIKVGITRTLHCAPKAFPVGVERSILANRARPYSPANPSYTGAIARHGGQVEMSEKLTTTARWVCRRVWSDWEEVISVIGVGEVDAGA